MRKTNVPRVADQMDRYVAPTTAIAESVGGYVERQGVSTPGRIAPPFSGHANTYWRILGG